MFDFLFDLESLFFCLLQVLRSSASPLCLICSFSVSRASVFMRVSLNKSSRRVWLISNFPIVVFKVKTAQCLFPAGNDPPDVKPGGEVIKTLEANGVAVECKEYAEVQHGFMPRGDLSDPKVVSACEEAEKLTYEFFSKHL